MKFSNLLLTSLMFLDISIFYACEPIKTVATTIKKTPSELINTLKILKAGLKKSKQELTPWEEPPDYLRINQATIFGTHESFQSDKYNYKTQIIQRGSTYNKLDKYSQLSLGVRYLDLRVWYKDGELFLCHGNCNSLSQKFIKPKSGFTKLVDVLKEITQFMKDTEHSYPKPVLIIALQGGIDQVPVNILHKTIKESGINKYALKTSNWDIDKELCWPTYGALRNKNKRVILGSNKTINSRYIFSDIFAKPRWVNLSVDYKRLLILEFGAQTDNKYIDNIKDMVKKLENHKEEYGASYIIRTMLAWWPIFKILFKPGTKKSMGELNTNMPFRYSKHIYHHGFKDKDLTETLWENKWPNIIAADFIAYGDISKAVQNINKNLRKIDDLYVTDEEMSSYYFLEY